MNITDKPFALTILVPVYNEIENLGPLALRLSAFLSVSEWKSRVIFVNDGSTDGGGARLDLLCAENPSFSCIHLVQNYGLSTALKVGFDHADTEWIGYIDADLQTAPEDFEQLISESAGYDLVTGIRINRKDHLVKRLSSIIANTIRRSVTGDSIPDTGCPLKIIRRETALKIPFFKGMHRFLPALVLMTGGKVKAVPVSHFPRSAGQSKYHLWNRLVGPANDLMAFRWMRRRYISYELKKSELHE